MGAVEGPRVSTEVSTEVSTDGTRWLVTGARGQLGHDLVAALAGSDVTAYGRQELDLTDESSVRSRIRAWLDGGDGPAVVLNAAAYTAVDAAETDEATAQVVNGDAPGWIATELRGRGRMVQVSTDYVFAGDASKPYAPGDPTGPRTAYGRTKLAGERAVLDSGCEAYVVRTAWVYSAAGANFVKTMLRLERELGTVSVVDDQWGSPTWTVPLAAGLIQLSGSTASPGIYHCAGSGQTTWYGFAQAIFDEVGADPSRVLPVSSAQFPRPAPRPAYSVLSTTGWAAAQLTPLVDWWVSLDTALGTAGAQFRASID